MAGQPPVRQIAKVNVAALARQYSTKSVETLARLLNSADERVAMEAATRLLDRGHGKSVQSIEANVNVNDANKLSDQILANIATGSGEDAAATENDTPVLN